MDTSAPAVFLLPSEVAAAPAGAAFFFESVDAAFEEGGTLFFFDSAVEPGIADDGALIVLAGACAARAEPGWTEPEEGWGKPFCS